MGNPARGAPGLAVLGAGSWGTALAVQIARAGHPVTLWGRDVAALLNARTNARYLPGVAFPDSLQVQPSLAGAVAGHRDVLICVPSHGFRELLTAIRSYVGTGGRVAWATKGLELATGKLPHDIARELCGDAVPLAVLSGPTFAREVGLGLPTAITVASTDKTFAADLAGQLSGPKFRAYTSSDLTGVEVGGAVKNVLAIGAGVSDGLGFGANARIALITRGLAEMTRLGVALGAEPRTFMGLAGMGDLVLTCTDDQSRNRRLGLMIARGASVADAMRDIGQVVEGFYAARAVRGVAAARQLEMPICEQVARIVHDGKPPAEAVMALMSRSLKAENEAAL